MLKNRLKVLRAERNWSQLDLAQNLEVSRQSVNAIETGKYDPSLPLAFRIAELFGLPIEEIFLRDSGAPIALRSSLCAGTWCNETDLNLTSRDLPFVAPTLPAALLPSAARNSTAARCRLSPMNSRR